MLAWVWGLKARPSSPHSYRKPFAVWRIDELVGFGAIGELHIGRVPFQLLIHADGNVAEQDNFSQVRCVVGEV